MISVWWRARSHREKFALASAVLVMLAGTGILAGKALIVESRKLEQETAQLREDLYWMQAHVREVRVLSRVENPPLAAATPDTVQIEQVLDRLGLRDRLTELHSESDDGVIIGFDEIRFAALVEFLNTAEQEIGGEVATAEIKRLDSPGLVSSRILLVAPRLQ